MKSLRIYKVFTLIILCFVKLHATITFQNVPDYYDFHFHLTQIAMTLPSEDLEPFLKKLHGQKVHIESTERTLELDLSRQISSLTHQPNPSDVVIAVLDSKDFSMLLPIFNDHSDLASLVENNYNPKIHTWDNVLEKFKECINKTAKVYVAKVKQEVLGMMWVWESEESVYMNLLARKANAACLGVGKKLVQTLLRDYSHVDIYLHVEKENPVAINLYQKLGFVKIEENDTLIQMKCEKKLL